MAKKRIFVIISMLIIIGIACSLTGKDGDSNNSSSEINGSASGTGTTTSPQTLPTNTNAPEDEALDKLPPLSFEEFLESGVEAGRWTREEGLVTLLKYFVGDVPEDDLPGISEIAIKEGSGLSFMAQEYLENPDADPDIRAELEFALRKLFPPDDVLEAISEPGSITSLSGGKVAAIKPLPRFQQEETTCDTLYEEGFDPEDLGITCYTIHREEIEGHQVHLYFPTQWRNAEFREQLAMVIEVFNALEQSIIYFDLIPSLIIPDISLVFSLVPDSDSPNLPSSLQEPSENDLACKLTMFPRAVEFTDNNLIQQMVAKQVFLCLEYWSFRVGNYDANAWWQHGSAEYFSNQVYPFLNGEFRNLEYFDERSADTPINEMNSESWVFFQYLGNNLGEDGVINLITKISDANGDIHVLADEPLMEEYFHDFVVSYLSEGILDTNRRDRIKTIQTPTITSTIRVDEIGLKDFPAEPFTAVRYFVDYEQQKRFLQTPSEGWNVEGRFSSVELPFYLEMDKWSSLPPEIRSYCEEDVRYIYVPTTTQIGQYNYQVEVTEVEEASCDPCLLGTWVVDNETFENYMWELMEQEGIDPIEGASQFGEFTFDISGEYLLEFQENGNLIAFRDGYTISVGAGGYTADVQITSSGAGTYAADGEILSIFNLTDHVTDLKVITGGIEVETVDAAGIPSYEIFRQSYEPDLERGENDSVSTDSQPYLCEDDILAIEMPEYGGLQFDRVDRILPTPVPTPNTFNN